MLASRSGSCRVKCRWLQACAAPLRTHRPAPVCDPPPAPPSLCTCKPAHLHKNTHAQVGQRAGCVPEGAVAARHRREAVQGQAPPHQRQRAHGGAVSGLGGVGGARGCGARVCVCGWLANRALRGAGGCAAVAAPIGARARASATPSTRPQHLSPRAPTRGCLPTNPHPPCSYNTACCHARLGQGREGLLALSGRRGPRGCRGAAHRGGCMQGGGRLRGAHAGGACREGACGGRMQGPHAGSASAAHPLAPPTCRRRSVCGGSPHVPHNPSTG